MIETHCWETYLVHGGKRMEHPIFAGWKIVSNHSPGWERTEVIPGNLFINWGGGGGGGGGSC